MSLSAVFPCGIRVVVCDHRPQGGYRNSLISRRFGQAPVATGLSPTPTLEATSASPCVRVCLLCRFCFECSGRDTNHGGRRAARESNPALLRAHAHPRPLGIRSRVASPRLHRAAGVVLESVRLLPVTLRLLLSGFGVVRDTAGPAVPFCVAGTARDDLARSVPLGYRLRGAAVRDALRCSHIPTSEWLVLARNHIHGRSLQWKLS